MVPQNVFRHNQVLTVCDEAVELVALVLCLCAGRGGFFYAGTLNWKKFLLCLNTKLAKVSATMQHLIGKESPCWIPVFQHFQHLGIVCFSLHCWFLNVDW